MDKLEVIKTEVVALLEKMVENPDVLVEEHHEMFHVTVKTDDEASTIIGRHGETIRAIQKILEVILYKKLGEAVDVLLNVNDYREKQKERLEGIAGQAAERVQSTSRPSHLRGFSSYERKIMHEYITQTHSDLTTYSVGEGRDRQLVIDLKTNAPATEDSDMS